jgi:uncharacterized protein YuzE
MRERYLEVTFRNGKALAAYLYLSRLPGQTSSRTERVEPGLVVDYDDGDNPIGIEITAPNQITLDAFNRVLKQLGQEPLQDADFSPLKAA